MLNSNCISFGPDIGNGRVRLNNKVVRFGLEDILLSSGLRLVGTPDLIGMGSIQNPVVALEKGYFLRLIAPKLLTPLISHMFNCLYFVYTLQMKIIASCELARVEIPPISCVI